MVIDISLEHIWYSWYAFRKGKRSCDALEEFTYYLERHLYSLYDDLQKGIYVHGGYRKFTVTDSKRRTISVASIRDRIVHRLLYEYLVPIFDPRFIPDVWSCRKGKGLTGCITRTHSLLKKHRDAWVWRADIVKFFDHVDHEVLMTALERRVGDQTARRLLHEVIRSYSLSHTREREREREYALRAKAWCAHRQSHQPNFFKHLSQ